MKFYQSIIVILLCLFCFPALAMVESQLRTIYSIEQSDAPNTLTISVSPIPPQGGVFTLRFNDCMQSQVENLTCDGKKIKENTQGHWLIPKGVHDLRWQVRLKEGKETDVGEQQSVKFDTAMLLSEGSSLPRFENIQGPEGVKISMPSVRPIYPEPDYSQSIALPDSSKAPLFILLNFTKYASKTDGSITLTYLLDDEKSHFLLPDIDANIKGLKWLMEKTDLQTKESFAVAWCKYEAERLGISGAAGSGILLAHYLPNKTSPSDKALMLYVALHEAFHQLQAHYPDEPIWVQESLASYYGTRAVEGVMPEEGAALMSRSQKAADQFPKGLLAIHSEVKAGNHSGYGAFYTKGVAFWAAVDKALRAQSDGLDAHLKDILSKMEYDQYGAPLNLEILLKLPTETWIPLREQFLLSKGDS